MLYHTILRHPDSPTNEDTNFIWMHKFMTYMNNIQELTGDVTFCMMFKNSVEETDEIMHENSSIITYRTSGIAYDFASEQVICLANFW